MFSFFKRSNHKGQELLQQLSIGAETDAGVPVNSLTAQSLPAVHCAVAVLSEAIASLPIHIYQKQNDERMRVSGHHIERLLNQSPNNSGMTAYDFKLALMRSMLLRGNGFARVLYDGAGKANQLIPLHPDAVIMKRLNDGRVGYQISLLNGKFENVLQEEMLHIKYHSDDGIEGKSPIQINREAVGLGLAQQMHGSKLFRNGARIAGALTTDDYFKDENRAVQILHAWNNTYSGASNAGKTALLENGLKFQPIGLNNIDAEWLESRKFGIQDVARMFKISPIFLMDYSNSTYSNFSEAQRAFLSQTLRPLLTNIQQALMNTLLTQRSKSQMVIEFETKDLLRATADERFAAYDTAIRNGIMNPNECRKAENMPPRDGGDEYSQSWIQKGQTIDDGSRVV